MAWTTPKTWTSEVLTSNDMNTYLSDNTQYLYDEVSYSPAVYTYSRTTGNYSTTSTTFVDIDASNMVATITTDGGDVLITFAGSLYGTGSTAVIVALDYDGTLYRPMYRTMGAAPGGNVSFSLIIDNVSAGSHTFGMKWLISPTGATVYIHGSLGQRAHFGVRELK